MDEPDIDMICVDCHVDTEAICEFFHVHDDVWAAATAGRGVPEGNVLCIGCVEARLGRQLTARDFTNARVNLFGKHSARLKNRLTASP